MGNTKSEFEQRFYDLYYFIQLVDDRYFEKIKIYRKNIINYDYVMVVEREISAIFIENNEERKNSNIE